MTKFYAVKYDVRSLEADPERPGRSLSYGNPEVAPPSIIDKPFGTREEAAEFIDQLMAGNRGEEVELTLANGGKYKGPRYIFTMGSSES